MTDIQWKYRNTDLRGVSVATAEITVDDVAGGEVDFTVTTIPVGSVISDMTVVLEAVNVAEKFTVEIAGSQPLISLAVDEQAGTKLVTEMPELVVTEDARVEVKGVDTFTAGRIVIMVQFVRFDVVNGDRVRAKAV